MTQEQKAKAYDEALERAKEWFKPEEPDSYTCIVESIFPELKESEDERIRKELISFLQLPHPQFVGERKQEKWIAWLEKQGQTFTKKDVDDAYCKGLHDATAFKAEDWYVSKVDGKIHNIHHSIDKVEPKFHEGDWIINNDVYGDVPVKIKEIGNYLYLCERQDGVIIELNKNAVLKEFKHWDITDAKDGDVLASELCDSIILFKGIKDDNIDFYCDYDFSKINVPGNRFAVNNGQHYGNVEVSKDFHPATKEQCDTLLKAMTDAGYTFDFEKKELKEIGNKNPLLSDFFKAEYKRGKADAQKPAEWSEEDNNKINSIKYLLHELGNHNFDNWLESLKDRGLPKQEWSEEDENAVSVLRHIIKQSEKIDSNIYTKPVKEKLFNWLESLKDRGLPKQEWSEEDEQIYQSIIDDTVRENQLNGKQIDWLRKIKYRNFARPQNTWKPSDEQLDALHDAAVYVDKSMFPYPKGILMKLYKQLKKLRED